MGGIHTERAKKHVAEVNEDLVKVVIELHVLFNDTAKVAAWMRTPNRELGGMTPITLLKVGKGKKILELIGEEA